MAAIGADRLTMRQPFRKSSDCGKRAPGSWFSSQRQCGGSITMQPCTNTCVRNSDVYWETRNWRYLSCAKAGIYGEGCEYADRLCFSLGGKRTPSSPWLKSEKTFPSEIV